MIFDVVKRSFSRVMRIWTLIIAFHFSCYLSYGQMNPFIVFEQPINATQGGPVSALGAGDWFGYDMAPIGDLNGDGVNDIAVGAIYDDDGGLNCGAVYVLFMNSNGTVGSFQKISQQSGGFQGVLVEESFFGSSIANMGDMNGDGVQDIAVGASGDDDGGSWTGAVWILFLNSDGTVNGHQKISALSGGFSADLETMDRFGIGVDSIGDLDNDGVNDLLVGAFWDDDGGPDHGAAYILFMNSNGTVSGFNKISDATTGFNGSLEDVSNFGWAVAYMGDVNSDGYPEIMVGAPGDNAEAGSVWIFSINGTGAIVNSWEISGETSPIVGSAILPGYWLGSSLTLVHDLWCDQASDIAVGLRGYGANAEGAVFLIDLNSSFQVEDLQIITQGMAGLSATLDPLDRFGWGVDVMYDYNGDGFAELMVGAVNYDEGGSNVGGTWLISLASVYPEPVLPDGQVVCTGDQLELFPSISVSNDLWSTGAITDSIVVNTGGMYWLSGSYGYCFVSDTTYVEQFGAPNAILGADTLICGGLTLGVAATNYNILWSTGSTSSTLPVTTSGTYWVQLDGPCGVFTDSISVELLESVSVQLPADMVLCSSDPIVINATITGDVDQTLWNTGSSGNSISVQTDGVYWISVSNSCSSDADSILISLGTLPSIQWPSDTVSCGLLVFEFDSGPYTVSLNGQSIQSPLVIGSSGTYDLNLVGPCGSFQENIDVTILGQPIADFFTRSNPTELIDPSVQLINQSSGASSFEWHLGDGEISFEENPLHNYDTAGVYLVMLVAYGAESDMCNDTAYGYVEVDPLFTFYVPNAFTPDSDGDNDTWGALGLNFEYESFELEVYDRWGGLIWETDNPFKWWDGTHRSSGERVKQGLYVYQFRLKRYDTFEPKTIKGTVTVYRHN